MTSHFPPRLAAVLTALAIVLPVLGQSDPEELRLFIGQSVAVDYPADVARISTSNPDVVDAVAVTTREFLLHAKGMGSATVMVWAKTGQRAIYAINVEQNIEPIRKLVKSTFPTEDIRIEMARDSLSLNGKVSAASVAERAMALVTPVAKSVVNNLQVAPAPADKQILLRVKFAEMDRNTGQAIGVNLLSTGALNMPGLITTGQFAPPTTSAINGRIGGQVQGTTSNWNLSDALNVFAFRPDLNIAAMVKALQSQGLLQILAEPNLVTTNGKEASFLVGGEFPVPVLQGGSNSGSVTVMFKEFGIRLTFLPHITPNGTIKMHVKPEVSTIDIGHGVIVSGFNIPALATRRIETDVELAEGQSFVIAGLMDDRVEETMSKVPGLAHIPILGVLFKSRETRKNKTELMVMVTPEIANPLQPTDPAPMPVMPKEFIQPLKPGEELPGSSRALPSGSNSENLTRTASN